MSMPVTEMTLLMLLVLATGMIAAALTRWLSRPGNPLALLDTPNERSLHQIPTPRTGGLAICVSLFIAWTCTAVLRGHDFLPLNILFGVLVIAVIAVLDDRHDLSARLRLLVQLCAASLLIFDGFRVAGEFAPGLALTDNRLIEIALSLLLTLWLINLYNFMDGMDGFAGGMAVIGFATLALLGWQQDALLFTGTALTIAAAAAGFLCFNFPPARIFMGDSGSTTLGFLVAALGIWASRHGIAPIWLTLVIFSPFIIDATVTLLKRALRGEAVWRAHRSHYYQRLVQLGWGHRRTVLAEYALMLACAVAAVWMNTASVRAQWGMLAVLAGVYLLAALSIHALERPGHAKHKT